MKISDFSEVAEIKKGWSSDKKYCVTDSAGRKYMLRISPAEQYEHVKAEFACMEKVFSLGINMCEPIECGICDEGAYMLQSWVEGVDVRDVIHSYSDEEIYEYGCEAGRILKRIHSIPAPEGILEWEVFFNQKMDRKIEMYRKCPLKYDKGEVFVEYIRTHRHLLANRPQTFQHGDYHIGNFMIDRKGKLVVIDFNREDYGDPWEEFNRIVWCVQEAPMFAAGMVDGYFENDVPVEFWELLALYIASNTLSSLPWAIPFGEKEIDVMKKQAADILEWYDGMSKVVPNWYLCKPK